jgi:hypothetical protein
LKEEVIKLQKKGVLSEEEQKMSRDENSAKKVLKKESDKNKNKIFCD